MANSGWLYPHLVDGVLIYQIKTTTAVHEDSSEMVSINYWVEHQGSRAFVSDTSRMVTASKVIGQADQGLNLGATGSTTYTSRSARLRLLFGM